MDALQEYKFFLQDVVRLKTRKDQLFSRLVNQCIENNDLPLLDRIASSMVSLEVSKAGELAEEELAELA